MKNQEKNIKDVLGKEVKISGEVEERLESTYEILPVSYTHLDVYKRQPLTAGVMEKESSITARKPEIF